MKCWDIDLLYVFKRGFLTPLKIKKVSTPPWSFSDPRAMITRGFSQYTTVLTGVFVSVPDGLGCEWLACFPLQGSPSLPQRPDHQLRLDSRLCGKPSSHFVSYTNLSELSYRESHITARCHLQHQTSSSLPFLLQISTSVDGRLCVVDPQTDQCLREISWGSPLTSVCCVVSKLYVCQSEKKAACVVSFSTKELCVWCSCVQGQYVIAGCAEGALHVWTQEKSAEISHIAAHKQRINHCSLLINTGDLSGK